MDRRIRSLSHAALAFALALAGAACAGSDALLVPNQGRVQFVLGIGDGGTALAAPAVDVTLGGGDPLHDGDGSDSDGGDHPDSVIVIEPPPPPRPPIKSANVTFTSILARNLDGVLLDVEMDLPVTVDVVRLEGGRQVQLPEGELPVGAYDQVVVVITRAEIVMLDDTRITIEPPGGGWTAIVPLCPPVEVTEDGAPTVALTLELRSSFLWMGDGLHFAPRFKPPWACFVELPPPPPAPIDLPTS